MGRLTIETRQRVVMLWRSGWKIRDIHRRLREEGTSISETSLYLLVSKFAKTGLVRDIKRSPRPSILSQEHYEFIDSAMEKNDELTAYTLLNKLKEEYPDLHLSISTVRRARKDLGWVSTRPKYCQLIREANKEKRLQWCREVSRCGDDFADVIWTDECTVELQQHSLRCFRKKNQLKKLKPRPKHPLKLHVWGGISCRGATAIVIFEGILIATKLLKIYDRFIGIGLCRIMTPNTPAGSPRISFMTTRSIGGKLHLKVLI